MNRYKLIKEYPGSPKIGAPESYIKLHNFGFYISKNSKTIIHKDFVEKFPEYWEKAEEPLEYQKLLSIKDVMDTLPFEDGETREYAWSHLLKKVEEIKTKENGR